MLASLDGNNTFLVQTDASFAGAGAVPLPPKGHEEKVLTFATHRVSKTDAYQQRPREREYRAVLWAIKDFRQYTTGRRFSLGINYPALTWLFHSRSLYPKLHI